MFAITRGDAMARPSKQQILLTFGHRLGLLKDLWGFHINDDFARYLASGANKDDSSTYKLSSSAVNRWITPKGGESRDVPIETLREGLVRYCVDKGHVDDNADADTAKQELETALQGSDAGFIDYVAKHPSIIPIPVPRSILNLTLSDHDGLRMNGLGLYVLYRIGREAGTTGRVRSLYCVPVKIAQDKNGLVIWNEHFFDIKASGYVFSTGGITTVLGDDPNPSNPNNMADLFFGQLEEFTRKGTCHGVLTMLGDDKSISAYSIMLERITDLPDAGGDGGESAWHAFAKEHSKRVPLERGNDGTLGFAQTKDGNALTESPGKTKYSKILEAVSRHPTDVLR